LQKQIKLLEYKIDYQFEKIFNPLADVKGLNKIYAAGIIAESGDITYFKNRDQYYNFTGLVPRFAQSGKFESKFNHMNKCGSSYLRHYFFQAAISLKRH
jgi:transposase